VTRQEAQGLLDILAHHVLSVRVYGSYDVTELRTHQGTKSDLKAALYL